MNKEDKELLIKDLSARFPYGVIIEGLEHPEIMTIKQLAIISVMTAEPYKPYLRPMSNMTKEEKIEFSKLLVKRYCEEDWEGHISTSYCIEIDSVYTDDENGIKYPSSFSMDAIDWLNAHHFDYRGLIEKGLALVAPEGMYKTK